MKKLFWLGLLIISGGLFWYFGISTYLTLAALKNHSHYLQSLVVGNYGLSALVYNGVYTLLVASGIPVVGPLSILGGFLFGLYAGFLFSLMSATLGSIIYFFTARYILVNVLQSRYAQRLDAFNLQIAQYGYTYLLSLHFLTIVPFFIINTLAAFANVPFWPFLWTTVVGCMPVIFIYVLAGKELSTLKSVRDILKLEILLVLLLLALLALAPMIIRRFRMKFDKK